MNPKTIDAIRDLALKYENQDLQVAFELMQIAHHERPKGPYIKEKFLQYREKLNSKTKEQLELIELVEKGEIAIIPIGFRCFTRQIIKDKLGLIQASLPFDSGFFSPESIVSIFSNPEINLEYHDNGNTHAVCIKTESNLDEKYGLGIKFKTSTYDEINQIAINKDVQDLNKYLDSTFGYYTLDKTHNFVLAHYNWHPLAPHSKSKGITHPLENLKIINKMLNKRIARMMDMCDKAKHIFFVHGEQQGYKYMQVDNQLFEISNLSILNDTFNKMYNSKFTIININNVNCATELLNKLKSASA